MSTTLQAAPAADAYLTMFNDLEAELARHSPPFVRRLREAAIARFGEVGFPNSRNEDWKFTNLAPMLRTTFLLPSADSEESTESYRRLLHQGDEQGVALAFINGNQPFHLTKSRPLPEGILVMSLSAALQRHPDLVERHLGRHADFKTQPFVALNTAFWRDGAFVYVPPGVVVEEPIQIKRDSE
jgi:Fe-S cluster assembly protein SufD